MIAMEHAMGAGPDARAAHRAVERLREATLDSVGVLIDGLHRVGGHDDHTAATLRDVLERLRRPATPSVIEPEFFEWYFTSVALIEAGDLEAATKHVARLPLVVILPLASAGLLGTDPLTIRHVDELVLSERQWDVAWPFRNDPVELSVDGDLLHASTTRHDVSVPWRDVLAAGTFAILGVTTVLRQSGWTRQREVAKYAVDLGKVHATELDLSLLPPELFTREPGRVERYAAGFACIAEHWPDLHDEVTALTQSISALDGLPFVGGSDIACFGASFFRLEPEWSDLCYADHIVHEAAHQRFHAEFEVEPALVNPADTNRASPIRSDPRPMEGSFHATFVFVRLAQFFERVVDSCPSLDALTRLHRHLLGAYTGVEMLGQHAQFTDRGAEFYEALREETNRMRRCLPAPDPSFYDAIAVDYERPSRLATALLD